jgi:hypothetical protein
MQGGCRTTPKGGNGGINRCRSADAMSYGDLKVRGAGGHGEHDADDSGDDAGTREDGT